jgi:hypothetical protein
MQKRETKPLYFVLCNGLLVLRMEIRWRLIVNSMAAARHRSETLLKACSDGSLGPKAYGRRDWGICGAVWLINQCAPALRCQEVTNATQDKTGAGCPPETAKQGTYPVHIYFRVTLIIANTEKKFVF